MPTKSLNPRNGIWQLILSTDKLIKCSDWLKIGFKVLGKHLSFFTLFFAAVQKYRFNYSYSYWLFLVFLEKDQIIDGCFQLLIVPQVLNLFLLFVCNMFRLSLGKCKCQWLFSAFGTLNRMY